MLSGELDEILTKIAVAFIPIKEDVKKQIFERAKQMPLRYIIPHNIQDDQGRTVATVGSLEDDLDSHVIKEISYTMSVSSVFLRMVLEKAINNKDLKAEDFILFLKKAPTIKSERFDIIMRGIKAYIDQDFISSIHLLIPQIEDAVRNLVELQGGNILKPSRGGGYHLRTFDEVLRDELVTSVLGEDLSSYMQILFTDQRGWNLRNRVCHGMVNMNAFNVQNADRVIHTLLCLGLLKKQDPV